MDSKNCFSIARGITKTEKIFIKISEKGAVCKVFLIEPIQNNLVQEEISYDVD